MQTTYKLSLIMLIAGLATLAGCKTATSLAKEIDGDWSGTPMRMDKKVVSDGTFTPVFRFVRSRSQAGGDFEMSAQLSVMMPVNAPIDSTGTSAVSATAAGIATVRGVWQADDEDEIKLTFDMSTLVINMDPDVEFELANIWTSSDVPSTRTVAEPVRRAFVKQMTDGISAACRQLDDIDDIHIRDNVMTCKYLGSRQTLTRIFE